MYIREGIRSIEALPISDADKQKIFVLNALKLLGLDPEHARRPA
jgi:aminocarboxymuconate-semialdehyde decarboxylase